MANKYGIEKEVYFIYKTFAEGITKAEDIIDYWDFKHKVASDFGEQIEIEAQLEEAEADLDKLQSAAGMLGLNKHILEDIKEQLEMQAAALEEEEEEVLPAVLKLGNKTITISNA